MSITIAANTNPDRSELTLILKDEDGEKLFRMNADQLTDLIEQLGAIRCQLQPPFTVDYAKRRNPGDGTLSVIDPAWRISGEIIDGRRLVAFRSDAYGWTHYLLSQDAANTLAEWLVKPANDPFANIGGSA